MLILTADSFYLGFKGPRKAACRLPVMLYNNLNTSNDIIPNQKMLGDFKIAKCIYTNWYLAGED